MSAATGVASAIGVETVDKKNDDGISECSCLSSIHLCIADLSSLANITATLHEATHMNGA